MELHWAANCVGDGGTVPEGISEYEANILALMGLAAFTVNLHV
jgi:hypothetical protein